MIQDQIKQKPLERRALDGKAIQGFPIGALIGTLGGLVGLGGAEFRLPILVGYFRFPTLEAIILNKALSLVVVSCALFFRLKSIPWESVWPHAGVAGNLLAGSLAGAWFAADKALRMPRQRLDRIIMVLLTGLALMMLFESATGMTAHASPLLQNSISRFAAGMIAGFGIGMVAALLGVAGGELLIPTIVLLYGADIKLAGSLSLMVSLPTMIVGFARYSGSESFRILRTGKALFYWMAAGSVIGAGLGGLLLGVVPSRVLMLGLGILLLLSAIKIFKP